MKKMKMFAGIILTSAILVGCEDEYDINKHKIITDVVIKEIGTESAGRGVKYVVTYKKGNAKEVTLDFYGDNPNGVMEEVKSVKETAKIIGADNMLFDLIVKEYSDGDLGVKQITMSENRK